jgi:hypothetical protein
VYIILRNTYITNLQKLSAAGNTSSLPLSVDILRFLEEGDISNPWLYMHKEFEDCEKVCTDLGERKCFLEVMMMILNTMYIKLCLRYDTTSAQAVACLMIHDDLLATRNCEKISNKKFLKKMRRSRNKAITD